MRILVTDGTERAALACVRAFARAGHEVYVTSSRSRSLAGVSRGCRAERRVSSPLESPAECLRETLEAIRAWRIEVLVPVAEASLLALRAEVGAAVPGLIVPFPPIELFSAISDKAALLEAATALGIAVPRQRVVDTPEEARSAAAALSYPLVLKPSRSVSADGAQQVRAGAVHAPSPETLERALGTLPLATYPVLVQERIVGPGVGVFALLQGGEVRALFSHERVREKPPSGGVSCYSRAVPVDSALAERAVALLRRFDWEGVAMVEFKRDARTGTPYLMEVNGRFWGSLQLAIDAGVDFPNLLLQGARGDMASALPVPRNGVSLRSELGDLDHLLLRLVKSDAVLALPPGAPSRLRTLFDVLVPWRPGERWELLRLSDPRPFLHAAAGWMRGA